MSIFPTKAQRLTPLFFALLLTFSCSKDSDLLADYMSPEDIADGVRRFVVDDSFFVTANASIRLDVLSNDNFADKKRVRITGTSNPRSGNVSINEDNTITYTPEVEEPTEDSSAGEVPITDSFTYTAEEVNENQTVSVEEGTVTVSITGENVYYVTTNGKSDNNGKTEATAWNISKAFASAVAGDIIYVKAGNYGNVQLSTSRSGTMAAPIKFIGYKVTPGDIVSTTKPTFTKSDWDANLGVLPSTRMPLLQNNPVNNNPESTDKAITVNHSYIHIENFMVQYYEYGFDSYSAETTGIVFKNCIANRLGNWDPSNPGWNQPDLGAEPTGNRSGYGIRIRRATAALVKNCLVIDAGHVGIDFIGCNNITSENCEVYSASSGNATDYNFSLYSTENSTVTNLTSIRVIGDPDAHKGRGLVIKCDSDNNKINGFYAENLRVQVFYGSDNNVLSNIKMVGSGRDNEGSIQIFGSANSNIFKNVLIKNAGGIAFLGSQSECGYDGTAPSGSNNYFINPVIYDLSPSESGFINYHRLSFSSDKSGGNNYIIGGTFNNGPYLFNVDRPNDNITLVNTSVSNITKGLMTSVENEGFSISTTYDHVNFYKCNFTSPSGSTIMTVEPLLNTTLFTLNSGSPLIDAGIDAAAKYTAEASLDFNGVSRGKGGDWDIGAFEF